jgi:phage terminase large subunit-like protein
LNEPTKHFLDCVIDKKIAHPANDILDWNAANFETIRNRDGLMRPTKPQDKSLKIDGLAAAVTAMSGLVAAAAPEGKSVYETGMPLLFG